ncbi:MAG: NADH-quinone oxidoreductase subunit K [Ilumatobacter sp.]
MSGFLVLVVGALTAVGVYLVTSRVLSRIVLGFALLGHAVVLGLLTAGGPAGRAPLADRLDGEAAADPLPQALSLTAIVISFGLTLFLLALARRQHQITGDDLVEDDIEDRRIAESQTGDDDPIRDEDPETLDADKDAGS